MGNTEKNKFYWMPFLKSFFNEYFDGRRDKDDEAEAVKSIVEGVDMKGATLWVLLIAIFLASLGLNVNSTAVIIGAMLISPLMGPIMGMGLGIGLNDFGLVKHSFKSYAITTIFCVLTSSLFFLISPVAEGQSELLARTSPTIYDVFIALLGGLAGFVALSTTRKGSVIPGVAIATALMPPLCTAGYGLATGNFVYFFGAFYLYFINSVFICVSTFLGTKVMRFRPKHFVDKNKEVTVRKYIVIVVVLTMIPAIYLTIGILGDTVYEASVNRFVREQLTFDNAQVVDRKIEKKDGEREIRVVMVGKEISDSTILVAQQRMPDYKLMDTRLVVLQGVSGQNSLDISSVKSKVLEDIYRNNEGKIEHQAVTIDSLKNELERYSRYESFTVSLMPEMKVLFPMVSAFSFSRALEYDSNSQKVDTVAYAVVKLEHKLDEKKKAELIDWMKVRTNSKQMRLMVRQ